MRTRTFLVRFGGLLTATALAGCGSGEPGTSAFRGGSPAVVRETPVASSPTPRASATPVAANPTTRPLPDDLPTPPGSYLLGGDALYGIPSLDITFTVADEGWISWGPGVVTTEPDIRDQVGMGFADVANLYEDPCRWRTGGVHEPVIGRSVRELVAGFAAQRRFTASAPTDVSLAGFRGSYLELTIDPSLDFSTCDGGEVHSWVDVKGRSRYYQGPGQVEQFRILDVGGTRLVIEGSFFQQASRADREALAGIIESIRVERR